MRNKYPFYILFIVLTFLLNTAFAQFSAEKIKDAKVSQATDEQITILWGQAMDQGLSEKRDICNAIGKRHATRRS